MRQHRVKRTSRKPNFFWQGVLILAPMLVLAKLGALAIWQDKRMAEHDAQLRAQDLAEQVADKLSVAWPGVQPSGGTFYVDTNGHLLQPKPLPPEGPATEVKLSSDQSNLLLRAQAAEFSAGDKTPAIELFQQFLATQPPADLAQPARYSLGLLFLASSSTTNAIQMFRELIDDPAPARGDAGGDLKTLSLFKLAMLSQSTFEDVCQSAVHHPTWLTPPVLRTVFAQPSPEAKDAAQQWWMVWQTEELQRHLYARIRPSFHGGTNPFPSLPRKPVEPPAWIWVDVTNEAAFAEFIDGTMLRGGRGDLVGDDPKVRWFSRYPNPIRLDTARFIERQSGDGYTLAVHLAPDIADWANNIVKTLRTPQYFGVSISLGHYDVIRPEDLPSVIFTGGGKGAGRHWVETNRGTNAAPAPLATASRINTGELPFVARVHLIGPELLFEQQESRSLWVRMVIAVAALTSFIGFISAYRAFHKQLRLAEMKSNFVSSVSHELRAPIASVRLMAEGLERGKISDPAKQREYFRFITQECRRLSAMIENVLDFARIEQGRKEYEFEPTDVSALVQTTVKLMEPYAEERGVKLNVPPASRREEALENQVLLDESRDVEQSEAPARRDAGGTLTPMLDGQAMQQALVNLLDNAIKHSPAGSEVTVSSEIQNPKSSIPNPQLLLSVTDHGPGIPATEHDKIFERFYRLGSELRRETPGVGIGLSIVKHIVEAHSGRVRVESEVGKGSCFTIELPLAAEAQRRRDAEGNE